MAPFRKLWSKAKDLFDRLLGRKPPEPGRFEPGSKWALTGFLSTAPWVLPRREYLVYVPRGHSRPNPAKIGYGAWRAAAE